MDDYSLPILHEQIDGVSDTDRCDKSPERPTSHYRIEQLKKALIKFIKTPKLKQELIQEQFIKEIEDV